MGKLAQARKKEMEPSFRVSYLKGSGVIPSRVNSIIENNEGSTGLSTSVGFLKMRAIHCSLFS